MRLLIVVLVAAIGYGSSAALAQDASTAQPQAPATGPQIAYVTRQYKPKLAILTVADFAPAAGAAAGGAIGAALGGAFKAPDAPTLVTENDLSDPAQEMAEKIAQAYAAARGGTMAQAPIVLADKKASVPSNTGAAYTVDVRTIGWGAIYLPLKWSRYKVQYQAKLEIVDTTTGKQVASESCLAAPRDVAKPPTFLELHAEGGALLRSMLASAADVCLERFKAKLPSS